MNDLLNAALGYAARGWRVLPLAPQDMPPLSRDVLDGASTDPQVITAWWVQHPDANIGVTTGPESDLVVIDLYGPEGIQTWENIIATHGLPFTLGQITDGPDGGIQWFFTYPEGEAIHSKENWRPGIHVHGIGGYVIVPPSSPCNGPRYRWQVDTMVAPLPRWLLQRLRRRRARPGVRRSVSPAVADAELRGEGKRLLDEAADWLRSAGQGERFTARKSAGRRLGRLSAAGLVDAHAGLEYLVSVAVTNSTERKRKIRDTIREMAELGERHPWEVKCS